ncbi:uncharacterized protein HD556DRAFT_1306614 [Suillus plorans]|uniref:Uncharacterized protein n=1 Tax=Suillus plorans TaxID=116603 RepID=A0A9P7IYZ8_9AGAM|nr:uncharacterized protein HD556DRAFT_1306614 [Suillus plorans]KAG1797483.1 hypothetical protein HD556DRAFT_1306614 [Suillus plorans]
MRVSLLVVVVALTASMSVAVRQGFNHVTHLRPLARKIGLREKLSRKPEWHVATIVKTHSRAYGSARYDESERGGGGGERGLIFFIERVSDGIQGTVGTGTDCKGINARPLWREATALSIEDSYDAREDYRLRARTPAPAPGPCHSRPDLPERPAPQLTRKRNLAER